MVARKHRVKITDVIGRSIYDRMLTRDPAEGGYIFETVGIPGSGKTSLLFSIYDDTITTFPEELVFLRDSYNTQCQFNRVDKWRIYAQEGVDLQFIQLPSMKEFHVPVTYFNVLKTKGNERYGYDFTELIDIAKPQQLNVVYLKKDERYKDLIRYLRLYPGWQTLLFDEYEDLIPQRCKGRQWKINEAYTYEFKHLRRGLCNLCLDTQNPSDGDWRVRSKIMIHAYLRGSKVDKSSPIKQNAVNAMPIGKMFIDFGKALYGKGGFQPYPPKDPILIATDLNRKEWF